MESARIAVDKVLRCPYCHETVAVEADWLACRQCLARHHTACWHESARCAACQGEQALIPGSSRTLEGPDPVLETRRETSRATLDWARRDERVANFLLGLATLGVHSFIDAASAFARHASEGDDRGDVHLGIERARTRAGMERSGRRVLAVLGGLVVLSPLLVAWGGGALSVAGSFFSPAWHVADDPALLPTFALQVVLWLPAFVCLHVYREAVRRHELQQSFARLVADAVPPLVAVDYLRFMSGRWNRRRAADVLLTLGGLVPVVGIFFLPFAGIRTRGALTEHEDNESLLPRRSETVAKA
jgi:hypothetical protein